MMFKLGGSCSRAPEGFLPHELIVPLIGLHGHIIIQVVLQRYCAKLPVPSIQRAARAHMNYGPTVGTHMRP
jgi:hypothetical protein